MPSDVFLHHIIYECDLSQYNDACFNRKIVRIIIESPHWMLNSQVNIPWDIASAFCEARCELCEQYPGV